MDGAVADIRKGASIDPKSVSDASRGVFKSPSLDLNQFIASNPSDARAYLTRGVFRLVQGQDKEAEQDFRKGVELNPSLKLEVERIFGMLRQPNK